ncbi:hypothetical protein VTN77DRAFT_4921 [Rasamsonia byssochlamydoides]|uniref:uncharacterized protein n=1 Tax=Rasamsonia byssochlamydoides TaxID=89139 RepID=UPI003742DC76
MTTTAAAGRAMVEDQSQSFSDNASNFKLDDDELPHITRSLASFVADTTSVQIPDDVKRWLKLLLLDYIGVTAYAAARAESSEPFFNAVKALYPEVGNVHHPLKSSTVFGRGSTWPPQAAALLNGAFGHSLDFDDTHMGAVVHPGVTVISAALAEGEQRAADGAKFLTALAVGYEVVCRLGLGLRTGGFERGFHNTSTAGIFGAIAAIAKLRDLDAATVEGAFGIGGSKAVGSMQYLANGAWNKRLHPGLAAHDAFLCIALAQAGVFGAEKAIEGDHGFLHAYTSRQNSRDDLESIVDGLGSQWMLMGTAIKPYPACRCAHPGIDLAAALRLSPKNQQKHTGNDTGQSHDKISHIESLRLDLSPSFYNLVGEPLPNKIHPSNIVDSQFSGYYHVAVAWLYGAQPSWAVYDHLRDEQVHALADRITITRDNPDFTTPLQAHLTVCYVDGSEESRFQDAPLGEPEKNPIPLDVIYDKFRSLVEPVWGVDRARRVREIVESIADDKGSMTVNDLMRLVA